MKRFGKLRAEMKSRHVTQRDIARALGVSNDMVSKLLCGGARWYLRDACVVLELLGYTGTTMLARLFPLDELDAGDRRAQAHPVSAD